MLFIISHKRKQNEIHVIFTIYNNLAFGYGKKTDLDVGKNPHQVTPPPDSYSIPTFAETNKKHGKGFTPRYSRDV